MMPSQGTWHLLFMEEDDLLTSGDQGYSHALGGELTL